MKPDSDKTNAGAKLNRWIWRLENLFILLILVVAEDVDQKAAKLLDDRKKAILLLYEAHKGDTELNYDGTIKVMSDYFKPRKTLKWK